MFLADSYAQSVLINKISASELWRKFIKSPLLVGKGGEGMVHMPPCVGGSDTCVGVTGCPKTKERERELKLKMDIQKPNSSSLYRVYQKKRFWKSVLCNSLPIHYMLNEVCWE